MTQPESLQRVLKSFMGLLSSPNDQAPPPPGPPQVLPSAWADLYAPPPSTHTHTHTRAHFFFSGNLWLSIGHFSKWCFPQHPTPVPPC